jgi:stress-induced morphogen
MIYYKTKRLMAIEHEKLYSLLQGGFPEGEIELIDTAGDSNHYEVTVKSEKFKDLSLMQQHKMVYNAIGDYLGKELHALKVNTKIK